MVTDSFRGKSAVLQNTSALTVLLGEPAEFGKNRTLRFSGHP